VTSSRLEAFSDAVIAIIITIMVLELHVPEVVGIEGTHWADLRDLGPVFFSYLLSFVYLGIYWNNHHHMLHVVDHVSGGILWANLHLLFWLSLFPFATAWMGESDFAEAPTALYGIVSLLAAVAYYILQTTIIRDQGPDSRLRAAIGRDMKGKASPFLYLSGIVLSLFLPGAALAVYVFVALMWLVPDRRIASVLEDSSAPR
jgi:uncharacterized membrane protein